MYIDLKIENVKLVFVFLEWVFDVFIMFILFFVKLVLNYYFLTFIILFFFFVYKNSFLGNNLKLVYIIV